MVNKDISSAVVLQIGYLQAMSGADLSWLESGIQAIDLHYGFRLTGLKDIFRSETVLTYKE